jgi:hypothetical protein
MSIEIIFNYFLKKKTIHLAPMNQTFFIYKYLDKKINLTQEIIALNYSKESPYGEEKASITSIIEDKDLYLWFHKPSLEMKKYLPLSLLLFRHLVAKNSTSIALFEGKVNKILVVKNNKLLSAFEKRSVSERDILLIKEEYMIDKVDRFSEDEYFRFLKKSYQYLTFKDLLSILKFQFDIKTAFNALVKWLSFPLLLTSILISVGLWASSFYIDHQTEELKKNSKQGNTSIRIINQKLTKNQQLNELFMELQKEFKYANKVEALLEILKVTKEMNMSINLLHMNDENINFTVKTENEADIPQFTTQLFKTDCFVDIKNISSRKVAKVITSEIKAKLKARE